MKKLITICITLLTFVFASAQKKGIVISPDDRDACYLYAVAESPLNDNCKILIISSYIHRQKYKNTDASDKLSNASSSYFGGLINAFNKKLDDVQLNERMDKNAGKGLDILFRTSDPVKSFKGFSSADGHCPINYMNSMPVHQSTRLFSKDCRERFIREKMKEGYHVFQLTFEEYYEKHYDLLYEEDHFNLAIDEVEKLSPLFVQEYNSGVIKGLPDYERNQRAQSNIGSIIVSGSSTSGSSTANKKAKKVESSSTSSKYDPSLDKYFIAPKTQQEKIADLSTEVGSFLGGVASQIEANRLETERKEAYKAAKIVVAGKKASIIIDEYLSSAEKGNEKSIIMVSEAYRSIDDASTNYNDRGENIKDRKDLKFLESINSKFYSPAAIESLLYLYNLQINYYKEGRKKERGKALSRILLGGAVIGGVILAGTSIDPIISTVGVLGGGILAFSGGAHAIMITSYGKKSSVYQYAIMRIQQLERRQKDKINAVEEAARLAEEERVRLAEIAEEARLKDLQNVGFAAFRVGYVSPTSEESKKLGAVPIYLTNGLPHYGGEFTPYANPYTKGQFGLETGFSAGFTGIINLGWLNRHMPSRIGFGLPLDINFAMMKYSWENLGAKAGNNAFLYTNAKYGLWGVLSGGIGLSLTIRPAERFYIDFIARPDFYLTTGGKYEVEGTNGTRNYTIETTRNDNSSGISKTFGMNIRFKKILLAFEMKQGIVEKEHFIESVKVTENSGTSNTSYNVKPLNLNLDYMQMTLGFIF